MRERCVNVYIIEQMVRILPILSSLFIVVYLADCRVLKPCKTNEDCFSQHCIKTSGSEFGVCGILAGNLPAFTNIAKLDLNSLENMKTVYVTDDATMTENDDFGLSVNDSLKQLVRKGKPLLLNNDRGLQLNFFLNWLISAKLVYPNNVHGKSNDSASFLLQNMVINNIDLLNNDTVEDRVNNSSSRKFFDRLGQRRRKRLGPIHRHIVEQKVNELLNQYKISNSVSQTRFFHSDQTFYNLDISKLVIKEIKMNKSGEKLRNISSRIFKKCEKGKTNLNHTLLDTKNLTENVGRIFMKKMAGEEEPKRKNLNESSETETKSNRKFDVTNGSVQSKIKNFLVWNHSFFLPFIASKSFSSNKTVIPISGKGYFSVGSKKSFPVKEESKRLYSSKDRHLNSSTVRKIHSKKLRFNNSQIAYSKISNFKKRGKRSLRWFGKDLSRKFDPVAGSATRSRRKIIEEGIVEEEPMVFQPHAVVVEEEIPTVIEEEVVGPVEKVVSKPEVIEEVASQPVVIEEIVLKKRSKNKRLPKKDTIKSALSLHSDNFRTSRHGYNEPGNEVVIANREVLNTADGGGIPFSPSSPSGDKLNRFFRRSTVGKNITIKETVEKEEPEVTSKKPTPTKHSAVVFEEVAFPESVQPVGDDPLIVEENFASLGERERFRYLTIFK